MTAKQPLHDACSSISSREWTTEWLGRSETREWAQRELSSKPSIAFPFPESKNLKAEIAALDSEFSRLHGDFQNLIWRKQACLAPIHRLHPELLSEIFLHLAANDEDHFTFPYAVYNPPSILTVYRLWRGTALSTATLFIRIEISHHQDYRNKNLRALPWSNMQDRKIKALKDWIMLSQSAPLDVVFLPSNNESETRAHRSAWEILFKHLSRWKQATLDFISPGAYIYSWLERNPIVEKFTVLKLSVGPYFGTEQHEQLSEPTELPIFPQLITLDLTIANSEQFVMLLCKAPILEQLRLNIIDNARSIQTKTIQSNDIELINQNFPTISRLRLNKFMSRHEVKMQAPQLHLDNLRECDIKVSGLLTTAHLSSLKRCSQMTTLKVEDFSVQQDLGLPLTLETVTSLSLTTSEDVYSWSAYIYDFLKCFPNLSDLEVTAHWRRVRRCGTHDALNNNSWHTAEDRFLEAMILEVIPRRICQHLKTLSMETAKFHRETLLKLVSTYSEARPSEGLLISLDDCCGWPNIILLDGERLKIVSEKVKY